jgi:hypothetical protein
MPSCFSRRLTDSFSKKSNRQDMSILFYTTIMSEAACCAIDLTFRLGQNILAVRFCNLCNVMAVDSSRRTRPSSGIRRDVVPRKCTLSRKIVTRRPRPCVELSASSRESTSIPVSLPRTVAANALIRPVPTRRSSVHADAAEPRWRRPSELADSEMTPKPESWWL